MVTIDFDNNSIHFIFIIKRQVLAISFHGWFKTVGLRPDTTSLNPP